MQIVSFISMFAIFYSVTACTGGNEEGLCAYRQEMSMFGTMTMLSLIGLRYVKGKKKNKEKKASRNVNPENKRD